MQIIEEAQEAEAVVEAQVMEVVRLGRWHEREVVACNNRARVSK